MSWKGVRKSISRLPHQFKTRNGGEEVTRDAEYNTLEKYFNKVVEDAEEIRIEAMVYRDSVSSLLTFQAQCACSLAETYGLQPEDDRPKSSTNTNANNYNIPEADDIPSETRQALLDYATAMDYCRQETLSQLDELDYYVVRPLTQLRDIVRTIQKTITKRQHKLIDFDRFRISYYKFSVINDPTPSEEKNMAKLQTQFENAQNEYEYFNQLLKDEFLQFLDLCQDLIEPIIQQFYNIQTKILGGIYGRIHEVIGHNAHVFPTINEDDIKKGFQMRLAEFNAREELDNTDLFREGPKPWDRRDSFSTRDYLRPGYQEQDDNEYLSTSGYGVERSPSNKSFTGSFRSKRSASFTSSKPPLLSPKPSFTTRARSASSSNSYNQPSIQENYSPSPRDMMTGDRKKSPVYRSATEVKISYSNDNSSEEDNRYSNSMSDYRRRSSSYRQNTFSGTSSPFSDSGSSSPKKRAPPPPPPSRSKKEYVEALYDLDAQQDGDLSFRFGDRIEVLEKSETTADWWKGKIGDNVGMFPANYVRII